MTIDFLPNRWRRTFGLHEHCMHHEPVVVPDPSEFRTRKCCLCTKTDQSMRVLKGHGPRVPPGLYPNEPIEWTPWTEIRSPNQEVRDALASATIGVLIILVVCVVVAGVFGFFLGV